YDLLRQSKYIAFISTGAVIARALVEKAFKLSKSNNSPVKASITNIATPVHVKALVQMLYQILDSIKGYCEWNNNAISYKINKSSAVITFIEVEHQKCLSARYFIKKLCSLIASTGECSIADTMAFKCFYMRNLYGDKDININD
ncbi:10044_t:CDS:2, partial [Funneliformis geosporum]